MAVDVTRQPRNERTIEADVVSPIVLGFLRTRIPLAMARYKRQLDSLDPARREELMKLYAASVGRGKDLAIQAMIAGDTAQREVGSASRNALDYKADVRQAQASENVAATREAGESYRQYNQNAFDIYVSNTLAAPEQTSIGAKVDFLAGRLNAPGQPFNQRIPNAMAEATGSVRELVSKTGNEPHKSAIAGHAVNLLRQRVQSDTKGAPPGYDNLTPDEKVQFNNAVAGMYGQLSIPFSTADDGTAVPQWEIEARRNQQEALGPPRVDVYSGGASGIPQARMVSPGDVVGGQPARATSGVSTQPVRPGTPSTVRPGDVDPTTGRVAIESAAPSGSKVQATNGYYYIQQPDGSLLISPEYGYGGHAPVMREQLAREQGLQSTLTDEMRRVDAERAEAMRSGAADRVSLDLFDHPVNPMQGDIENFGKNYSRLSPADKERADMRLTEALRALESKREEAKALRAEEGAASKLDAANVELTGDPGPVDRGDPSAFRVGAEGTASENMEATVKRLNDERATLEASIAQNKLTGEAARDAMVPWYAAVGAAGAALPPDKRDVFIDSLTGAEGVKLAARTVVTSTVNREGGLFDPLEGFDEAEKALDKSAEKALGPEYSKREADRTAPGPSGTDQRENLLFTEAPALPKPSESPVRGELFNTDTPGTAAPVAKPKVDELGAGADVVSGSYRPLQRDELFTPGRDIGDQAAYVGLKRVYAHTTGKDPDDPANEDDYQTFVSERMKKRRSQKEPADATQP